MAGSSGSGRPRRAPRDAGRAPPAAERREGERAAWGSLSRQEIVDAALAHVETAGFESLTIRGLSAQLGVAPMSLYRHVRDKDDLLDEVVDRLLERLRAPELASGDWRAAIGAAAEELRDLLVRHPAARHVYLLHPVVSPGALKRMNAMLEVLHRAGFDEYGAEHAYAAVQTYTIGFAALEASREGWHPPEREVGPIAARLAAYTTPQQFAEGLAALLDGIERHRRGGGGDAS